MAELVLDSAQCSSYNAELSQELGNYTKVVNEIGTQCGNIGSAWTGSLSENFISQLEGFLPNLTIGYNIIEKSGKDLSVSVNNDTKTDEGA